MVNKLEVNLDSPSILKEGTVVQVLTKARQEGKIRGYNANSGEYNVHFKTGYAGTLNPYNEWIHGDNLIVAPEESQNWIED